MFATSDGGLAWTGQPFGNKSINLTGVSMPDANTATAVASVGIYQSGDRGKTWRTGRYPPTSRGLIATQFTDSRTGIVVGGLGNCSPSVTTILRTTDGGASWTLQSTRLDRALYAVYFTDANNGWAVGEAGTILHTTTGGEPATLVTQRTAGKER